MRIRNIGQGAIPNSVCISASKDQSVFNLFARKYVYLALKIN